MQGRDAPRPRATATHLRFCKQATSSSSKANQHALPSIETSNRAAKESRCLLRGCRGTTLPALARRLRTSDSANKRHPARPKRSIGTLRSTFKKTPNRAAKEPRHPLRGCRGATLPALEQRSRTSDSANKQRPARPKRSIGTLCATLNRNAQPRSKRTLPPLRGCRGATLPALARRPHTSDSANKQHPARQKRTNMLYPQ